MYIYLLFQFFGTVLSIFYLVVWRNGSLQIALELDLHKKLSKLSIACNHGLPSHSPAAFHTYPPRAVLTVRAIIDQDTSSSVGPVPYFPKRRTAV
jgi:hypothetical protein